MSLFNKITKTFQWGGRTVRMETGEIARQAGDWDLWAGATAMAADGYRDHSAQSSERLSVNLGRRFGQGREVRLILSAADIDNEIPGALGLGDALNDPTKATGASVA